MKLSKVITSFPSREGLGMGLLSFICFLLSVPCFASLSVDMGGTMATLDTLDSYMAGPGCYYTKYRVTKGSKIRTIYLLDVDLNNANNKVEVRTAQDKLGVSETLAKMYTRWDAPEHRLVGGINCTPYIMSVHEQQLPTFFDGLATHPAYAVCSNGQPVCSETQYDRGYADVEDEHESGYIVIDNTNTAFVNDFYFTGWLAYSGNSYPLYEFNRPRKFQNDSRLSVYNHLIGKTPVRDCQEVIFTTSSWTTNTDLTGTVVSLNTTGGTTLQAGQGSFQALNDAKSFLTGLKPGDSFSFRLNMTPRDGSPVGTIEQLAGGYSLNMLDGNLTQRNYDEAYNSGDYPRPMTGISPDGKHLWIIEMQTPGMTTAEGCYILKKLGATAAAAYDGGGSAQMFVNGSYALKSSDAGGERALPVALWVVATAPDSQEAGQLQFVKPLYSIPAYASYTPTLRAWTAEGLLLSHDYKGYTLSCEPASLGTISADGLTFIANPVSESGKLIATAGTGRTETPIEIRNGEVHIVLDSVILGNRDYKVDVQAIAGDLALPLDAKALTWLSMDESRCTVNDEGILHAMANGRTQVIGSLAEFSDTLLVITEMATNSQLSFLNSPLSIDTAFSNPRTAAGVLPINVRLWGNPDSILIVVNSDAPIQAMELTYRPNNGESDATNISGKTAENKDYTYTFATDQLMDVADQGIYPILLQSAKFTLKNPNKSKSYHFTIKDIILCYRDWAEVTALPTQLAQPAKPVKLMVNGQIYIIKNNHVYDVRGHERK